jgi:hypothetical protein
MEKILIDKIGHHMEKEHYIYERYGHVSTYAILRHDGSLTLENLSAHLRISDFIARVDDEKFFITYTFTTHMNAYKAAQNTVYCLERDHNISNLRISIDTFEENPNPEYVIRRLERILAEMDDNVKVEDGGILH